MPIDSATIATAIDRVRMDIMGGFDGILDPIGGLGAFSVDLNDSPLASNDIIATSEIVVVVPWVYRCKHTGTFLNVPATYVEFGLLGTTFVHVAAGDPDAWTFYRYIDYLCALHHMGVSTSVRPALGTDEYLEWKAHAH